MIDMDKQFLMVVIINMDLLRKNHKVTLPIIGKIYPNDYIKTSNEETMSKYLVGVINHYMVVNTNLNVLKIAELILSDIDSIEDTGSHSGEGNKPYDSLSRFIYCVTHVEECGKVDMKNLIQNIDKEIFIATFLDNHNYTEDTDLDNGHTVRELTDLCIKYAGYLNTEEVTKYILKHRSI